MGTLVTNDGLRALSAVANLLSNLCVLEVSKARTTLPTEVLMITDPAVIFNYIKRLINMPVEESPAAAEVRPRSLPSATDQSAEVREGSTQELPPATENAAEEIQIVENTEAQPESLPSDTDEEAEATTASQKETAYYWHKMKEEPPDQFDTRAFHGEQWQIAWALGKEKRILERCTVRTMTGRLINERLWGKRKGNDCVVYVKKTHDRYIDTALNELETIKDRGRYHHKTNPLPKIYKKYEMFPLKSKSEDVSQLNSLNHLDKNSLRYRQPLLSVPLSKAIEENCLANSTMAFLYSTSAISLLTQKPRRKRSRRFLSSWKTRANHRDRLIVFVISRYACDSRSCRHCSESQLLHEATPC